MSAHETVDYNNLLRAIENRHNSEIKLLHEEVIKNLTDEQRTPITAYLELMASPGRNVRSLILAKREYHVALANMEEGAKAVIEKHVDIVKRSMLPANILALVDAPLMRS